MKKYVYALMGAAMMMSIASCSQDVNALDGIEEIASVTTGDDEVMVTFEMGGEITSSESALTRGEGSTDDLYGVIIIQDGKVVGNGLFDNVSLIRYAMSKNSKYRIIVTIVKNGKNILKFYDSRLGQDGYLKPFGTWYDTPSSPSLSSKRHFIPITNCFRDGYEQSKVEEQYVTSGYSNTKISEGYYPVADRFYGELNIFTPTEDCTVTLPLKRTAFGLKYKVSGITDGTVSVKINKSWKESGNNRNEVFFEKDDITDTYTSEEKIITFKDVKDAWQYAENYTDEVTVSIKWTRGVGIIEDLGTKTIRVKRNRMNVVNINLSANDGSAGLSLVMDDLIFSNETANIHVE